MGKLKDLLLNKNLYDYVELEISDLEEMAVFFTRNIDCPIRKIE